MLALTRRGADLEITTRVLDKDNANAVLFDHTVLDTTQSDPVLPNRTVKGLRTELDPGGLPWALQSFGYPVVNIAWFNPQSAPNPLAQVVYDNLEVRQYASPLPPGTRYVNINNPRPASPYTSWSTAATNIQSAVDAALPGDQIMVNDGLYANGGRAVYGTMTNRVAVTKPLTLRSVNGPQVTVIQGYQVPGTTNGDGAVRCVHLVSGASVSGFTLTNGATRTTGDWVRERSGGGLWCESSNAIAFNCVLAGNSAQFGGGVHGGTLDNCTLSANTAFGDGGNPMQGGSAGGAASAVLNNCILTGNAAGWAGGGVGGCTLNNCTLTGNSAPNGGGAAGVPGDFFPVNGSALNNCIVYFNSATNGANYDEAGASLDYCCTTPMPTKGIGNITNAPSFLDYAAGNLRLQSNSPCINAGRNAYEPINYAPGPADLDGNPRVASGTVDIGAYEYQGSGSMISYAWLQQYGLPPDGSADFADPDTDGLNTWQEWRCQTCPTNAVSALRLLSASSEGTNVTLTWESVAGVSYFLERSTSLTASPVFSLLARNLPGQPGTTSFRDTNDSGRDFLFYRVGVTPP